MSKVRTKRQHDASMRNWGIRQLRALQAQCCMLAQPRRAIVFQAIDEELMSRGAHTHDQHVKAIFDKWNKPEKLK